MFIRAVDQALETMLRQGLPLPEEDGDISFEAPTSNWSAQLSRINVNLFLCDIGPSTHPSRSPTLRTDANGKVERRKTQPMIRLCYLVSAWAGSSADEHQLLGDVISLVAGNTVVPPDIAGDTVQSSISLAIVDEAIGGKLRDMWSSAGGQLKASFLLEVHAAADTFGWEDRPPLVTSVGGSAAAVPRGSIRRNQPVPQETADSFGAPSAR
jgi:hypothetical protein